MNNKYYKVEHAHHFLSQNMTEMLMEMKTSGNASSGNKHQLSEQDIEDIELDCFVAIACAVIFSILILIYCKT